jgi:hypothetical protein
MKPGLRFDVFARDGFQCKYCGRKPPEVTLHVDHVDPRCNGGSDDLDNLKTSCSECNLGKSGKRLDMSEPVLVAEDAAERREQVEHMTEAKTLLDEELDREAILAERYFCLRLPLNANRWPGRMVLRDHVRAFGLLRIFESIDAVMADATVHANMKAAAALVRLTLRSFAEGIDATA